MKYRLSFVRFIGQPKRMKYQGIKKKADWIFFFMYSLSITAGKYCEKGKVLSASINNFYSAIQPDNVFRTCEVALVFIDNTLT